MWIVPLASSPSSEERRGRLVLNRCPHCNGEYGSASLSIHVARCRAKNEEVVAAVADAPKPKQVPTLASMCIKFILGNMQVSCMNGLYAQPMHQAWLIASLPEEVLQQVMMHIVHRHQVITAKHQSHKLQLKQLKDRIVSLEHLADENRILRRHRERVDQVLAYKNSQDEHRLKEMNAVRTQLLATNAAIQKAVEEIHRLKRTHETDQLTVRHTIHSVQNFLVSLDQVIAESIERPDAPEDCAATQSGEA
ncbi:hypothetical protein AC1031_014150 [Aphanomyces cochlioides]|nr:hypothetical protein AC1031_014150 [Aphanomyces cochlioides]